MHWVQQRRQQSTAAVTIHGITTVSLLETKEGFLRFGVFVDAVVFSPADRRREFSLRLTPYRTSTTLECIVLSLVPIGARASHPLASNVSLIHLHRIARSQPARRRSRPHTRSLIFLALVFAFRVSEQVSTRITAARFITWSTTDSSLCCYHETSRRRSILSGFPIPIHPSERSFGEQSGGRGIKTGPREEHRNIGG